MELPLAAVEPERPATSSTTVPGKVSAPAAGDLFALAFSAMDAGDRMTLSIGRAVTLICADVLSDKRGTYTEPAMATRRARTVEADEAKMKLEAQCSGFAHNDLAAIHSMRSRFTDKLVAMDGKFVAGVARHAPSKAQIADVVKDRDWFTFDLIAADAIPILLESKALDVSTEPGLLLGIAFMLAPCDLGKDCSGSAVWYLSACAQLDLCEGSQYNNLLTGLTKAQISIVNAERAKIVSAFNRGDHGYFTGRK